MLCFVVLTTFAFALLYGLYQGTQWMHEVYSATSAHCWRTVATASANCWRTFAVGWRSLLRLAIPLVARAVAFAALVPIAALIWVALKSFTLLMFFFNSAFLFHSSCVLRGPRFYFIAHVLRRPHFRLQRMMRRSITMHVITRIEQYWVCSPGANVRRVH